MKKSIEQFTEILEGRPVGGDWHAQIADAFRRLLRWMVAEPVHAKLLNRIFLDNPQSAPVAAKKYWLPLMARLTEIFPDDYAMGNEELRLHILFLMNSIFQMALSIELQVLLIGERVSRNELRTRYEAIIQTYVANYLVGNLLSPR